MTQPLNLNEAIYNLQKYLRALSFTDARITRPPLDGLFDTDTKQAVTDFQRTRGITPTGVVDKDTWDSVFREYQALQRAAERPSTPNFFPSTPDGYAAELGEESSFVALIQMILKELSSIYDGIGEIEINGTFDGATENAVKHFQSSSGIDASGKVDLVTFNRLTRDFFNYSPF